MGKSYLTIKKISAYNKSFDFSNEVWMKVVTWDYFAQDTVGKQFVRYADSVSANIAEGFGRGGNKEFSNFLTFTVGSANEVQSQLYRALDQEYITESEFKLLYEKADEIIRRSGKLIQYLKSSNHRGIKFK